jgi:glutamate-1-semialdehyde 2,1-aminomutase
MKHPGTFNANPLSAAAGVAALRCVADGEPCRQANQMGRLVRQKLNKLFADRGVPWVCYGEFSGFKLLTEYQGPWPTADDFIPYGGVFDRLERSLDRRFVHAFRCAMLLHGVDLPGLGGMTTAAHTEDDIARLSAAVGGALNVLREEGLV